MLICVMLVTVRCDQGVFRLGMWGGHLWFDGKFLVLVELYYRKKIGKKGEKKGKRKGEKERRKKREKRKLLDCISRISFSQFC